MLARAPMAYRSVATPSFASPRHSTTTDRGDPVLDTRSLGTPSDLHDLGTLLLRSTFTLLFLRFPPPNQRTFICSKRHGSTLTFDSDESVTISAQASMAYRSVATPSFASPRHSTTTDRGDPVLDTRSLGTPSDLHDLGTLLLRSTFTLLFLSFPPPNQRTFICSKRVRPRKF